MAGCAEQDQRANVLPRTLDNGRVRWLLPIPVLVAVSLTACAGENEHLVRATAAHPQGRQLFERYNCIRCHDGGEGGFGKRMIGNPNLRDLEFIKTRVLNGKVVGNTRMPAFPLPKDELEEVSKFVRALAGWEQ